MSKGSKSSNKPAKEFMPHILGGASTLTNTYNQTKGPLQDATNLATSLFPGVVQKYQEGNPAVNAAQDYATNVLNGQFLDQGNPYLQDIIDQTGNDVRNQVGASLGVHGLTGGSDFARIQARELAKNAANLRYNNYAQERGLQQQAAGLAPGIAAADTIQLQPTLSLLNAYNTPLNAASQYASSLGGLLGGYQTQKQTDSPWNTVADLGSTALGIAAFSDERLKTGITPIGKTDGGLTIYTFQYIDDPQVHMGVLAQDVEEMQPDALGPEIAGFKTVDYSKVK